MKTRTAEISKMNTVATAPADVVPLLGLLLVTSSSALGTNNKRLFSLQRINFDAVIGHKDNSYKAFGSWSEHEIRVYKTIY